MPDFLRLEGRTIVVFGVANRKSVAYHCGKVLEEAGARVVHIVRSDKRREELTGLLGDEIYVCDVEQQEQIDRVRDEIAANHPQIHGLLHSLAFANYGDGGLKPFHETGREDFLQAVNISAFSLIALADAFKDRFTEDAAVVTVGISTTRMAAENYGYMAPIKAALESAVVFLAKSFAARGVRFNAVCPGLLKTSASAGIPGYIDSYLFAEMATLRKRGVQTEEVANAAAFLLSPRSSGINAQRLILDAGMSANYFDAEIVRRATRPE